MSPLFAFLGMPGHLELLIIAAIILLLFGHRLPSVMRSLGTGITQFKRGLSDTGEDLEDAAAGDAKAKDE
ncbi:MAG: twin-arginine translocase TatA/TatE family subunit [Pirellulaceae bacterium]